MIEASTDSFAQGFDTCTYQVKVISPDFPTLWLNVFDEEPLPAEVDESTLSEIDAPSAAVPLVAEGMGAEVVPNQETPSSAVVAMVVKRTPEAPASERTTKTEDSVLQRRPLAVRTETATGATSGKKRSRWRRQR